MCSFNASLFHGAMIEPMQCFFDLRKGKGIFTTCKSTITLETLQVMPTDLQKVFFVDAVDPILYGAFLEGNSGELVAGFAGNTIFMVRASFVVFVKDTNFKVLVLSCVYSRFSFRVSDARPPIDTVFDGLLRHISNGIGHHVH